MTGFEHCFDRAIALTFDEADLSRGRTCAEYWNLVTPFGGVIAATVLQAILTHPKRQGDPIALTITFTRPIRQGDFNIRVHAVRTGRSTQHWRMDLHQDDDPEPAVIGTAVFAIRRATWSDTEHKMPDVGGPDTVPRYSSPRNLPFLDNYDIRYVDCDPFRGGANSVTQSWIGDMPSREIDFPAITAYCDLFISRLFVRRQTPTPISTVAMSINFHIDSAALARAGRSLALGQARANVFNGGFYDQEAKLWADDGMLLATSHQVVWFQD